MLESVREAHELELDREAMCSRCPHRGKHHTDEGCAATECGCPVPLRLVRCVVEPPRYVPTARAWAMLERVPVAGDELEGSWRETVERVRAQEPERRCEVLWSESQAGALHSCGLPARHSGPHELER